jgi:hypothetical protein
MIMTRLCSITVGLLLALSMGICFGCSRGAPDDKQKVQPVSDQPPKLEPHSTPASVLVNAPPVASKGDCAPRYKNGLTGTCINNQPCRGFGVLDEKRQAECSCYGIAGGCRTGQRCDTIRKSCVPEEELPFERLPGR